jgi:hypothetical protein
MRRVELINDPVRKEFLDVVAEELYRGEWLSAGKIIAEFTKTRAPKNARSAIHTCWDLVKWCLERDHYADAARLLWRPNIFTPLPRSTQMVWDAIDGYCSVLLMGASSMSKSYSCGVLFALDWVRDPEYTTILVVGPTEDHLNRNLFPHLTRLHREATLPMPGEVGEMFIGLDRRNRSAGISGVVIPRGPRAAGKLQGAKRFQRSVPHPIFGGRSRLRVLLDEIENIPSGVWSDLDNLTSNIDVAEGAEGLKIVGAFNPKDVTCAVAQRAEPEGGWKKLDPDKDEVWTSKRGWRVVRLDAEKSENVLENREIYPGLQTRNGLEKLAQSCGGKETAGYFTFGRALYPLESMHYSVVSPTVLSEWEGEFIWLTKPTPVAGVDVALEGVDTCMISLGYWGTSLGYLRPPDDLHPAGRKVLWKTDKGVSYVRPAVQISKIIRLPKAATVKMAQAIRRELELHGVRPEWAMLDRTGNGAGVHDVLRETWNPDIRGLNFSESASDFKILEEDLDIAKVLYDRVYSEVWFALSKWCEFGLMKVMPGLPEADSLYHELIDRRYDPRAKCSVEPKKIWRRRQSEDISPDYADSAGLLLHCVRAVSRVVPSAFTTGAGGHNSADRPPPVLPIDSICRFDDLD